MPNPYFASLMEQVRQKAPRAVSEMAHWHKGDDLDPKQRKTWDNAFSFIECTVPPPPHPTRPDEGLGMSFVLNNRILGIETFWLDDDGNLTADPNLARLIPRGWKGMSELRSELRDKAHEGVRLLTKTLKETAGVPKDAIYNNLP